MIINVILRSLIFTKEQFQLYVRRNMFHLKFHTKIRKVAVSYTYLVLTFLYIFYHLKRNAKTATFQVKNWNQNEVNPRVIDSPYLPRDTRITVTLAVRPLLMPVAQKLYGCKCCVLTSRMCVHSRTLLCIETCNKLWGHRKLNFRQNVVFSSLTIPLMPSIYPALLIRLDWIVLTVLDEECTPNITASVRRTWLY